MMVNLVYQSTPSAINMRKDTIALNDYKTKNLADERLSVEHYCR